MSAGSKPDRQSSSPTNATIFCGRYTHDTLVLTQEWQMLPTTNVILIPAQRQLVLADFVAGSGENENPWSRIKDVLNKSMNDSLVIDE